jgi:hypothetical protein
MKIRGTQRIEKFDGEPRTLLPGQTVRGRVVKRIGRGRFRVAAEGILFDASSDLELEEGQRLTAQVEVQDDRVYLHIQDEPRPPAQPPPIETPEQIARLLKALGNQPDSLDIVEFQERLARCWKYSQFPGVPPSDAWVLAILWTRGTRAGTDTFALLSYYLRGITLNLSPATVPDAANADLYKEIYFLCDPHTTPDAVKSRRDDSPQTGLLPDREEEALRLLNREAAALGHFHFAADSCPLPYRLLSVRGNRVELRLTDHPVLPTLVIEAGRGGGIAFRTHLLAPTDPHPDADDEERSTNLIARLTDEDIEVDRMEFSRRDDTETLRAIFWKKHPEKPHRDLTA